MVSYSLQCHNFCTIWYNRPCSCWLMLKLLCSTRSDSGISFYLYNVYVHRTDFNSLGTALFCCKFNLVDIDLCYCSQAGVLFPHWVAALAHTWDAENAPPISGVKPEKCCDHDIFCWILMDLHPVRLHPIRRLPFSRIIKYSLVQSALNWGAMPPRPPLNLEH